MEEVRKLIESNTRNLFEDLHSNWEDLMFVFIDNIMNDIEPYIIKGRETADAVD